MPFGSAHTWMFFGQVDQPPMRYLWLRQPSRRGRKILKSTISADRWIQTLGKAGINKRQWLGFHLNCWLRWWKHRVRSVFEQRAFENTPWSLFLPRLRFAHKFGRNLHLCNRRQDLRGLVSELKQSVGMMVVIWGCAYFRMPLDFGLSLSLISKLRFSSEKRGDRSSTHTIVATQAGWNLQDKE
jgi:hypothetical protein